MNYYKFSPNRGLKISTIIVTAILLTSLEASVFALSLGKTSPQKEIFLPSKTQRMAMIGGNSLLPITGPHLSMRVSRAISMVVTAYSSTVSQTAGDPFVTASGELVRDGIVANNLLPFGTKIKIPEIYGEKIFIVKDRMHRKNGYYHIDIWFPDYWQAKSFGKTSAYIEILEN